MVLEDSRMIVLRVGILRDHNGSWLFGFVKNLIVETDCKDAINLIYSRGAIQASLSLVLHIQTLLQRDWSVVARYIPRSLNILVDGIAKMVEPGSLALVGSQTPSVALHAMLEANSSS
ncbi:hypothetical protein V6N13_060940 [Hibiscus sabdariffa]